MDKITDEWLREIAADEDEWARFMAAELLALRAHLRADDQCAWEALGKPEGTHETTNVQRLCTEVERLRSLIRQYIQAIDDLAVDDSEETQSRYERTEDELREVARG